MGQTAREGEAAASDGDRPSQPEWQRWQRPHPWRRQTGSSQTLPVKRSVVHIVVSVPSPLMQASTDRASTTKGLATGGSPGPAAPTYGEGGCRRGKAASGRTPTTHRAQRLEIKGPLPAPQQPPLRARELGVGAAPCRARVCRSTRPGLAWPHSPAKHPYEAPLASPFRFSQIDLQVL